jgi:hypothetical protein
MFDDSANRGHDRVIYCFECATDQFNLITGRNEPRWCGISEGFVVLSEQAESKAVKCAEGYWPTLFVESSHDAMPQLSNRSPAKGECQNFVRGCDLALDQTGDPLHDYTGFSRAWASGD